MRKTAKSEDKDFVDYSHEVNVVNSSLLRFIYLGASWFFVGLAVIGIFLPVLPTTPFLLLAAFFYAKSSVVFYNWIMNHRWFGPPLRRWKTSGSISRKNKIWAVSLIWLSLGYSIVSVVPLMVGKVVLFLIGASLTVFLVTRPEQ